MSKRNRSVTCSTSSPPPRRRRSQEQAKVKSPKKVKPRGKAGTLTSKVWDHMTKHRDGTKSCNCCEPTFSEKTSTTSLRIHLQQAHKDLDLSPATESLSSPSSTITVYRNTIQNIRIDTPLSIIAGWANAQPHIEQDIVCQYFNFIISTLFTMIFYTLHSFEFDSLIA